MSKVAIVTDSNSGITQAQAKELGIRVMPMPFYINEEMLLEDIDLTQEQFYERLTEGADIHTPDQKTTVRPKVYIQKRALNEPGMPRYAQNSFFASIIILIFKNFFQIFSKRTQVFCFIPFLLK